MKLSTLNNVHLRSKSHCHITKLRVFIFNIDNIEHDCLLSILTYKNRTVFFMHKTVSFYSCYICLCSWKNIIDIIMLMTCIIAYKYIISPFELSVNREQKNILKKFSLNRCHIIINIAL